jgi:molybdate transport system substrate-binding protein
MGLSPVFLCFAALLKSNAAPAAELRVMISAGFLNVYSKLGPEFERATGHRLITIRGPSTGDSPEAIPARLARGERADVVILEGGSADELGKVGLVRADSKVVLAQAQTGLVVRDGARKPDISSVARFSKVLLSATSIAYSDSGSGRFIVETLLPKLGIADQVMPRTRKVRGPPSGEPVAAVVARGEAEIGFQQVSELINTPGADYVGTIPAELQPGFTFAGQLTRSAENVDAATALLRFLNSPEADAVKIKAGLMPARR